MSSASIIVLGLMLCLTLLPAQAFPIISNTTVPDPSLQIYVQGFVYCKPCHAKGYNLKGAEVGLSCSGSPFNKAFTDENGYFQFRLGPQTQADGCEAHAIASHNPDCQIPKGGLGKVTFSTADPTSNFYSTGPFYFQQMMH